jgi:putative peptidoglycan lipid II flippase
VLLSRILGLVRDVVFAGVLGADRFTDEYVLAFAIPDWINYLLAGGYMAITFIPILSRYLARGDEEGGWRAFGAIARPVALGMTALVVLAMVVAEPVIRVIAPDFTPEQVDRTVRLTRIVLPAQVFFVVGSLFMAVQYARERFVVPTFAPIIYNLGIIAGGVLYNVGRDDPSPEGFAWGVLAGSLVGNFALQWWGARREGLRIPREAGFGDPVFKEYLMLAVPLMVGQSLVLLDEQLGRTFGTFTEDGGVSWLQFARRTMLVPVGVIAQAAGVAAYPYLARLHAEGDERLLAATVERALRYVIVLSLFAATGLVALSIPIVRLLYQRGGWEAVDTVETAGALVFFGLGVPLWGAQQIISRGFYARREMWTPVVIGTAATVAAIPIYWALLEAYEVRGLALASTVALTLYTVVLGAVWYRRTGTRFLRPVLRSFGRALPLAALGGLAAWAIAELLRDAIDGAAGALLALAAGGAALGTVVVLTGGALRDLAAVRSTADGFHLDPTERGDAG